MKFPDISREQLLAKLKHPGKKIKMVLDTDTYNEVDDQFALAYALKSDRQVSVEAVYAAPFYNDRSSGPEDGMEKSYEEILRILELVGVSGEYPVFKGSKGYLTDVNTPRDSEAARDIIERAEDTDEGEPLYVVAIGAITNIASAILMEPEIINKIVVVWLGGNALYWPDTREFNLKQDLYASRLIFNCGVPLVQIPCMGVTTHLQTTIPELEYYLRDESELGTYLVDIVKNYTEDPYGWSKVIWDIAAIAWLINPGWMQSSIVHSPILTEQLTWSFDNTRHFIRSVNYIERDHIFADLFKKLSS